MQTELFYSGIRPAVSAGLSVSRVGGNAQIKAVKKVSGTLRLDLAAYHELEAFTQFGSDVDDATLTKLERGKRTIEVLKQDLHEAISAPKLAIIIYALTKGYLDKVKVEDIRSYEKSLYSYLDHSEIGQSVINHINQTKELPSNEVMTELFEKFQSLN